jgi:hypothetical protein
MKVTFDHSGKNYAAAAVTKPKKQCGCWNCRQTGHHSSACPNPSLKNRFNATAKSAGATSAAPLGNCGPSNDEDDDSFDKEIDVVWG